MPFSEDPTRGLKIKAEVNNMVIRKRIRVIISGPESMPWKFRTYRSEALGL